MHSTCLPWHEACEDTPRQEQSLKRTLANTEDAEACTGPRSGFPFCPLAQQSCSVSKPTNTTLEQKRVFKNILSLSGDHTDKNQHCNIPLKMNFHLTPKVCGTYILFDCV